jgi:hypothetical protein
MIVREIRLAVFILLLCIAATIATVSVYANPAGTLLARIAPLLIAIALILISIAVLELLAEKRRAEIPFAIPAARAAIPTLILPPGRPTVAMAALFISATIAYPGNVGVTFGSASSTKSATGLIVATRQF